MKSSTKIFPISITLFISFLLGFISIYFFKEYAFTVFVALPIFMGFLPAYLYKKEENISFSDCYKIGFMTLGFAMLGLLVFALEGIICIAMASPICLILTFIGAYFGFIARANYVNPRNIYILLVASCFGFLSFDTINDNVQILPIKSEIIINAEIEKVWENVVSFHEIPEPEDWIFKTGIAYPIDAKIKGEGVDAIRYCNFTTGSFVEPITTWDEPNLLQFDVTEQPIPMNEFNPFWEIHPPHLDGYFQSQKGQFKLTKISETQTRLEGTTWYKVDIKPEFYWRVWSDFVIHRIHLRVLNHIKKESEKL